MRFINLTYPDNTDTWVNLAHIVAFEREKDNTTTVVLSTGGNTSVRETPTEILAKFP